MANTSIPRLPKIDLNTATYNPAVFTPQVFTPLQSDISLLSRSLDKLEEREEKADNQRVAIAEAFTQARKLLPDNEETNKYITDNQNRITDSIKAMINIGDMSGAIKSSKELASDFMSSPEYVARTKEHEQRLKWIEQLDRTNVDDYIKDYYKHTYSDKNNFTYDDKGNVTGTKGFNAPLPSAPQSAVAIIEQAVKGTADERTDTASDWGRTNSDGSGGSGHSSFRREHLSAERISENAKAIVNNDVRIKQAFVDQFNAGMYQISKLEKQLSTETDPARREEIQNQINGFKNSFYQNEAPIHSAEAYINKLFDKDNDQIKKAAYDYKHTNSGSESKAAPDKSLTGNGYLGNPFANLSPGAFGLETENVMSFPTKQKFPVLSGLTKGNRNGLVTNGPRLGLNIGR